MEIFLGIFILFCFLVMMCLSFFTYSILDDISINLIELKKQINDSQHSSSRYICNMGNESPDPNQPTKPNDWDSIRESFTRPIRIEKHERDRAK
jgi:hypothetical protein